jgi:P-type conjugative transfer protein TrbG
MKRLVSTLVALLALTAAPFTALAHPIQGPDGVLRFPFGDKEAPAVFCAPLYVCDIILEPGETVLNYAIGDSARWMLAPAASGANGSTPHILLKPTDSNLSTNLIVTTSKRTYYVDLHSLRVRPMLRVGFFYPAEPDAADHSAAADAHMDHDGMSDDPGVPAAALDYKYQSSGSRELFPTQVYNDGKHTYVRLDPRIPEMPALLAVGPDGDQVVNYRVKDGDLYIVDAIPDRMALVVGSGKHQLRATITHKT